MPAEATTAVTAPNAVIFEFLGNALVYSVNYERALTPRVGVRVGVMHLPANETHNGFSYEDRLTLVPLMVHYLTGARNKHLEVGGGIVFAHGDYRSSDNLGTRRNSGSAAYGTVTFGYRYQKPAGRNIFRIGLTPVFDASGGLPWLGIATVAAGDRVSAAALRGDGGRMARGRAGRSRRAGRFPATSIRARW